MPRHYLSKILNARVYEVARETPLEYAAVLSGRVGNDVWLKREDIQPQFSFKLRGAYNKMASLPAAVLRKGVVCASAGNHAQGVALAARKFGIRAVIVMPRATPQIKVQGVRALGGEAILHGENFEAAEVHARALGARKGLAFVHPYDDPDVIAGQGTIGAEILKQHQGDLDAVFVPVGGGGLIAGIAVYLKQLRPSVKVIGVEPEDADSLARSLRAGRRVSLGHVNIFAEGVAVRRVGEEPFRLCRKFVDGVVVVSNDEICAAIKDIFEDRRSVLEPSGALSFAGLKRYTEREGLRGRALIAIASGANVNFDRLRHVSERAEIGERREAVFAVTIPERPGSYRKFLGLIGDRNITEFNYRYSDPRQAHIFLGVQVQGPRDGARIAKSLRVKGYSTVDMTDNEAAKLHIRHLVGGRIASVTHERILRFEFPERPGALLNFLNKMGDAWNISLFHYRNHGADFGRVLAGIQVPPREKRKFQEFLRNLGYEYVEETDNPAYRLFLGS